MKCLKIIFPSAIIAILAVGIRSTQSDELQNDFDKLQGVWTLYYAEQDGSSYLPGASVRLMVRADKFLVAPNTAAATLGEFALDRMSWPRQINYTPLTGPSTGQTYLGIYDVIGSIQRVCFAPPGQPRPTDFNTFPGSGRILNVWLKLQ
jgi:uncharacterized protein (TIGR03067 family)